MTLLSLLLTAVQQLPEAIYINSKIMRNSSMSLCQQIIAAVYSITNQEQFGFYVAEEHVLIEKILEVAELPFTGESAAEVKSKLLGVTQALNKIGVDVTRSGGYVTVFGPGVLKHVE